MTTLEAPARLDRMLEVSLSETLNRIGAIAGLSPLNWEVMHAPESTVIESRLGGESATKTLVAWASHLGMSERKRSLVDGTRSWSITTGEWYVEIFADSRVD